jgi:hypothetical protein
MALSCLSSAGPQVIDIDASTVALLRVWKRKRGSLALSLARDEESDHHV